MSSEKEKIVDFLIESTLKEIILNQDSDVEESFEEVEEIFDELSDNLLVVLSHRRGVNEGVPKSIDWRDNILPQLNESRFRQKLRMERTNFWRLVDLLKDDEVFNNAHSSKQFPVEIQLAITLYRLGSSGESGGIKKIASTFGVGDGGTILKITNRVFAAILKLRSKYIHWPDENERTQIVANTFDELPFCVGYIDGTEIKLSDAPVIEHSNYYSRKQIYAIKLQVVCDYTLRIRHVVVGHPSSWHDTRMYRNSLLYKKEEQFLNSQQWIAGDSAYPLSQRLITPYRNNSKQMDRNARCKFNLRHSSFRVRVEHCFGVLKEKFCSLKELRTLIVSAESHQFCCDWVVVCCILHNFLIENGENPNNDAEIEDNNNNLEDLDEEEPVSSSTAEIKRQAIYSLIVD